MAKEKKEKPEKEPAEEVKSGGWDESSIRVRSRKFPGPAAISEPLRIAMGKEAYADLVGHAKESVDREICGVMLGDFCEDEEGAFVVVEAAVRGGAAKAGGTHVTFTQETWNEIHAAKEDRYPKLAIVGWYHSHPGFGVEFSDMDMFIQKNFFAGQSQIAFVSDPLGGEEAICANVGGGIAPIGRFWVDGRERRCYMPPSASGVAGSAAPGGGGGMADGELAKTLRSFEDRIRQLTDMVEKQRNTFFSFLTFLGVLACFCFLGTAGYEVWQAYYHPVSVAPLDWDPFPLMIDGKPMYVLVQGVKWKIPPELNAYEVQARVEFLKEMAAEQAKKDKEEAASRAASQPGSTAPATQ